MPTKIPPDKALIVELLDLLTDFPAVLWNGVPLLLPTVAIEALGLPALKPLIIKPPNLWVEVPTTTSLAPWTMEIGVPEL